MNLNDRKWKKFAVVEVFDEIKNSKAYHKKNLETYDDSDFPYITRTTNNNGLKQFVEYETDYEKNPGNTIVFSAEAYTFFYQPHEYITGNKMYYIKDKHFNKYVGLFLVGLLNNYMHEKYSYNRGLTATRFKRESILLPVNNENEPDYEFMEEYAKYKEKELINKYLKRISESNSEIEETID